MGLTFKLKEANRQRHQNHTDVEGHRGEFRGQTKEVNS